MRTKSTDRWPLQNEGTDFWRKPTSFPSFVMPRLHSSSSPIEESCTSFPALQGIITKTTKPTFFTLQITKRKQQNTENTKNKTQALFFSFLLNALNFYLFIYLFFFFVACFVREKMKVDFIFGVLEFYPFLWNDCGLNASALDLCNWERNAIKRRSLLYWLFFLCYFWESQKTLPSFILLSFFRFLFRNLLLLFSFNFVVLKSDLIKANWEEP